MAVDYYLKELPGSTSYKEIEISDAFHLKIKEVSWKHGHVEVRLPEVHIDNSIFAMVAGEEIPLTTKQGRLYYKGALLLEDLSAKIFAKQDKEKYSLSRRSALTASVIEEGTAKFSSHHIIPPFSAQRVSLHLDKGSMLIENKKKFDLAGTLALGTLECNKNHLLSTIVRLLRLQPPATVPVTCGNIHFIIQDGIGSFRKTAFVIDQEFLVMSKGTANFVKERLNMDIGLMSASLEQAFGIDFLPPGYMVPFKVDGTFANPQFHTKKAIAHIAAILLLKAVSPEKRTLPATKSF